MKVIRLFVPPTPCNLFGNVVSKQHSRNKLQEKSPSETGTSMRGNKISLAVLSQDTIYLASTMNF